MGVFNKEDPSALVDEKKEFSNNYDIVDGLFVTNPRTWNKFTSTQQGYNNTTRIPLAGIPEFTFEAGKQYKIKAVLNNIGGAGARFRTDVSSTLQPSLLGMRSINSTFTNLPTIYQTPDTVNNTIHTSTGDTYYENYVPDSAGAWGDNPAAHYWNLLNLIVTSNPTFADGTKFFLHNTNLTRDSINFTDFAEIRLGESELNLSVGDPLYATVTYSSDNALVDSGLSCILGLQIYDANNNLLTTKTTTLGNTSPNVVLTSSSTFGGVTIPAGAFRIVLYFQYSAIYGVAGASGWVKVGKLGLFKGSSLPPMGYFSSGSSSGPTYDVVDDLIDPAKSLAIIYGISSWVPSTRNGTGTTTIVDATVTNNTGVDVTDFPLYIICARPNIYVTLKYAWVSIDEL